jgi:hypothetical protein
MALTPEDFSVHGGKGPRFTGSFHPKNRTVPVIDLAYPAVYPFGAKDPTAKPFHGGEAPALA